MQNYQTLELIIDDTDLEIVLTYLLDQVNISVPYCAQKFGTNNTINDIWHIGKRYLTYHQDDKNIEQIQSVGTLFENNIHGKSGHGDCDCFTVFTLAMILANWRACNIKRCAIVLQGNSKEVPSHILSAVYTKDNECIYLDFTEPNYNTVRKYNYMQILKLNKF